MSDCGDIHNCSACWAAYEAEQESKAECYARQAEEAREIVDGWPDSIKRNIINRTAPSSWEGGCSGSLPCL